MPTKQLIDLRKVRTENLKFVLNAYSGNRVYPS